MSAINRGFFISAIDLGRARRDRDVRCYLPDRVAKLEGVIGDNLGLVSVDSFNPRVLAIGAVLIGIVLAAAIQLLTGYFTETNRKPVDDVSQTSLTGPATVILAGISVGLESAVYSALLIGAAVYGAFLLGGGSVVLVAVRHRARRLRPAHHRRRHRLDGHLRPGLGQRAGHRGDVRRRQRGGRQGAHLARRGRQHHQGDHQGHRDRDRRARGDRAVRRLPRHRRHRHPGGDRRRRRRACRTSTTVPVQRDPRRRRPAQPRRA